MLNTSPKVEREGRDALSFFMPENPFQAARAELEQTSKHARPGIRLDLNLNNKQASKLTSESCLPQTFLM